MDDELAEREDKFQIGHAVRFGKKLFRGLVNFIVPPKCLVCRVDVTEGASLCVSCWQALQFLEHPVCDVMGTPFAYDQGEGALSAEALAAPPVWDRARAAVVFNESSKGLVHALKYQDHAEAALFMVRMMARAGRDLLAEADIIMPVPLHPIRLWKRRFNQAALLAKPLGKQASKPVVVDLLLRKLATRPQVGLNAVARAKNVRKAFHVPAHKARFIEGKTILLIDDVRTTGATINACAEILKKAGATKVNVLSFALVLEPHRFHIDV